MDPSDPISSAALAPVVAALRDGRSAEAENLLRSGGDTPPCELVAAAEVLMRRRQWAAAAWLLARTGDDARDVGTVMKLRLSANLAALQEHRPAVYERLAALPAGPFSVAATPSGHLTVQFRRADGTTVSLSCGPDPVAFAAATLPKLYGQTRSGEAVALCGLGDGYLASLLAQNPPTLFMDKLQPVYLIEPEPHVLLQCLMIHEYAAETGPIVGRRFYWFVGPRWREEFGRTLSDDLYLPAPSITVGQGVDAAQIQAGVRAVTARTIRRDAEVAAAISRHYADLDAGYFASAFGGDGPRPPRVLLLTTRFSTVLQYSTRDSAAAFERLGWEARVMMEPSPHHRVLRSAIAAALADFRPDLVFQIDHLRHEHQGLFPENLPFACWIQDHLPHLATTEVGGRVGEFDFVLTDAIATYADKFAYPARQCIPLPKLVVRADPANAGDGPVDDLVFVSNASGTSDTMLAEALGRYGHNESTRELITRCCGAMAETYERGEALPTYNHVSALLSRTLTGLGLALSDEGFDVLARWLTHPFNDALYRQQALRWAAQAAEERGLTLALYGKGWDAHPEFSPFARGPVAYGEPLRQLTRRSRINLQIVPYLCLHQRLLDGLMAGGFFLIRTHPADLSPAALLRFLDDNGARSARTTGEARVALDRTRQQTLEHLIGECRPCLCTTGNEDVVAMSRGWEEAGQLTSADGPLPMLSEVGFHDAKSLSERVGNFAGASALRASVAANQRRSIGSRLSYDAGVRRAVGRMRELLVETAARKAGAAAGGQTGRAKAA